MLYQAELQARIIIDDRDELNKYKKKEVIQPQVPLRLPCDDLTHLTELRFDEIN